MTIIVKGRVLPSWGNHSKAVRVHNEDDFLTWVKDEGVTSQVLYEKDEDGERRPSVYLSPSMAARVKDGDLVELTIDAQDTKRGRNLRMLDIHPID